MKLKNFFSLFLACVFALTLFSCQNDEVDPDHAVAVAGTYTDSFGTDKIAVTKTGDNEVTLSNASGTPLSGDVVLTITSKDEDELIQGVKSITYNVSNNDVTFTASEASALGQTLVTYSLIVTGDSGDFSGTK